MFDQPSPVNRDDSSSSGDGLYGNGPLPNRFTRSTATGCLGVLCVLVLPALLFVPIEQLHLPRGIALLIPLVGASALGLGMAILASVPSGAPGSRLLRTGRSPVLERPATKPNRIAFVWTLLLTVMCITGYLTVNFLGDDRRAILGGTVVVAVCGSALIGSALLAVLVVGPIPAWRWVKIPIHGGVTTQVQRVALPGFVAVVWSLVVAADAGYAWAPMSAAVLICFAALMGPVLGRLPRRMMRRR
jgi:hypothetical protein